MATIFVSAVDGSDADNGSTWSLAKGTVNGALAIAVDGDVIKVDNAGTLSAGAAITWTPPASAKVSVISVNRASADAPTAGAKETTNGNFGFTIASATSSQLYVWGMIIEAGAGGASASASINLANTSSTTGLILELENCTLRLNTTSSSGAFNLGGATDRAPPVLLRDCTFVLPDHNTGVGAFRFGNGVFDIVNPTISFLGSNKPTQLIQGRATTATPTVTIRDGDISGYNASSSTLVQHGSNLAAGRFTFKNLKLSASPTIEAGTNSGSAEIIVRNCDSGDTINVFEYRNKYGALTENASVYAASGAEFAGAGISWQVVTTAACSEHTPFRLPTLSVWNEITSAQTATVEIVKDGATDLTDREMWLELSYPASASFPNYANDDDRATSPAIVASGTDQPNSAVSWTGTGGFTNENKQYASVAFTAAEKGLLEGRLVIAKASTTLYVDPLLRVA